MLRRFFLMLYFLLVPPLISLAFYVGSKYLLAATNKAIDEQSLDLVVLGGLVFFYFLAFLEIRSRWSVPTYD